MWDPVLSTISANVTNPCQIVLHNLFIFLFIPAESLIILPIATDFGMSVIKNHELLQATLYAKAN